MPMHTFAFKTSLCSSIHFSCLGAPRHTKSKSGAQLFVDSTLIERKVKRTDVTAFYIPATRMAQEAGIPTLANMIMVGKMIRETGMVSFENIREALSKVVSAKHADLLEVNLKAIETGYRFEG